MSVTIENSNEEVTIDVSDDKGENQNSEGEVIINAGKEDTKGVSDETEGDEDDDGEDEDGEDEDGEDEDGEDEEDDDDEEFEDYESMLESMRNVLGKTSGMCFLIPFIRSFLVPFIRSFLVPRKEERSMKNFAKVLQAPTYPGYTVSINKFFQMTFFLTNR